MTPPNISLVMGGMGDHLTPEAYQRQRRALIRFFEWNRSRDPEDLADEVMVRLIQSLNSGVDVQDEAAYVWGIAANVLREHRREREKERGLRLEAALHNTSSASSAEQLARDLKACLKLLRKEDRTLIQTFYAYPDGRKAGHREKMVERYGLPSINALRIRASRLRQRLAASLNEIRRQRGD